MAEKKAKAGDKELPEEAQSSIGQGIQPSEEIGDDVYASDPTPGAVTGDTKQVSGDGELPMGIREGSWVVLRDSIPQELIDEGARAGMVAVVMHAPVIYVDGDDFSPIRHARPNTNQQLVVKTRDEKSLNLSVDWEDVELTGVQAAAGAIPVG